jgi:hypothetical protein
MLLDEETLKKSSVMDPQIIEVRNELSVPRSKLT